MKEASEVPGFLQKVEECKRLVASDSQVQLGKLAGDEMLDFKLTPPHGL